MEISSPELPVEILELIFNRLDDFETCWSICRVSQQFYHVIKNKFDVMKLNNHLRVSIAGHVDAGKSSLLGYLLWHLGLIPAAVQKSAEAEKPPFKYAYAADAMIDLHATKNINFGEVNASTSFTVHVDKFKIITFEEYAQKRTLYRSFVYKPMLPDLMIIVVSADIGEFEAGICREGSTRLHLMYACTSGIENIVFAISKMESKSINKKKERWDEIVQELQSFCKRANVKAITTFVPINSLTGENILDASNSEDKSSSQFAEFYNGPTLMDVLKSQKKNTWDLIAKPARVLIQSFNGSRLKGMVVAGIVRVNETLSGGSSELTLKVKAIWNGYKALHRALPGEVVEMEFESKAPQENWSKTKLIGVDLKFAKKIIIRIHVVSGQLLHQSRVTLKFLSGNADCSLKLLTKIQRGTFKVLQNDPYLVKDGEVAVAEIIPSNPICVETWSDYACLGTFSIAIPNRWMNSVAVVTAVEY